jgi:hypothetical protein
VILFLDFDGVLHPDPCFDAERMFEKVPRLTSVLDEFPEIRLVLSTSWRIENSLAQMCELLGTSLSARVIGATPHFASFHTPSVLRPYPRHAECLQWMITNGDTKREWIAIDDRASMFAPDCDRLIQCDSSQGLDEPTAGRLRFALLRARRAMEKQHRTALETQRSG